MMQKKIKETTIDRFAAVLVIFSMIFFTAIALFKYNALLSTLHGLGMYDQAIWNTIHGDLFQVNITMTEMRNYLGVNFSPILFFFIPFYLIIGTPIWLIVSQIGSVCVSAVPIYLLAKENLKNPLLALMFLSGYLIYAPLQNGLVADFNVQILAIGFASWAFYFLIKQKDIPFIITAFLLAICHQYLAVIVIMMGLYCLLKQKRKKFGLAVALGAFSYLVLVYTIFIPMLSQSGLENGEHYLNSISYYSWLGKTPKEILLTLTMKPYLIIFAFIHPLRIKHLFDILIPLSALPIFSSPMLMILPLMAINFLSSYGYPYNIYFYYSALYAPFLFYSSIWTYRKWILPNSFMKQYFYLVLCVLFIYGAYSYSLTAGYIRLWRQDPGILAHGKRIHEIEKLIPANASLSVQNNIGAHLTHRQRVYIYPLNADKTDYILVDSRLPNKGVFTGGSLSYVLQMEATDLIDKIEKLKTSADHETMYDQDGFVLLKKIVAN
jgi:uncharacterized membrane protein